MRSSARALCVSLLLAACSDGGRGLASATSAASYHADGIASWYGDEAAGHLTASGTPFDPDGMTAAHRTLPLGSWARVTALDTGRSVVVRVTDRGPGRRDRLIDLSLGAARLLGTDRDPLARVRVRAVAAAGGETSPGRIAALPATIASLPPRTADGAFVVQVASFSSSARAQALAASLGGRVATVGAVFRVTAGPYADAAEAQRARDVVAGRGYGDARILPAP